MSLVLSPLLSLALPVAHAGFAPALGGAVEVQVGEATYALPLLRTEMEAHLSGDLATVTLTQSFANPLDVAVEGTYAFPLPADAAVYAMRMTVGDEVIEAQIRQKEDAKAEYEAAKREGKAAALLVQERPNVFTQQIANLVPGETIQVAIEYAHAVPRQDGGYAFHFPMVVGPRYTPAGESAGGESAGGLEAWALKDYAPVNTPQAVDPDRVGITVHIDGGMPVRAVASASHALEVSEDGPDWRTVRLAEGRAIDNQDFVLSYQLEAAAPAVGVTTWSEDGQGVVSLLIEPPGEGVAAVTPREMVFLLDCSGSMSGVPMDASKRFIRQALQELRPSDRFRIIRFSEAASGFSEAALPATPENIRAALGYVEALEGTGGTQMVEGIKAALTPEIPEGYMRMVVFLTDGYIGNEAEVIELLEAEREDARLFSFGIGNSVNRWLIEELARAGRGVARVVRPDEDAGAQASALAARLQSPVLTDIRVDWGEAPVHTATPTQPPDLFLGSSLRIMGKVDAAGEWPVTVHGRVGGAPVTLPVTLTVSRDAPEAGALPVIWSRSLVEDGMVDYLSPFNTPEDRERIQGDITALGLKYGLVTQWTSFVAVSKAAVNPGGESAASAVPTPGVEGVSARAYSGTGGFSGVGVSGTPEPAEWAAILMLMALTGWRFSRFSRDQPSADQGR